MADNRKYRVAKTQQSAGKYAAHFADTYNYDWIIHLFRVLH
jgi:hypothetical protein